MFIFIRSSLIQLVVYILAHNLQILFNNGGSLSFYFKIRALCLFEIRLQAVRIDSYQFVHQHFYLRNY